MSKKVKVLDIGLGAPDVLAGFRFSGVLDFDLILTVSPPLEPCGGSPGPPLPSRRLCQGSRQISGLGGGEVARAREDGRALNAVCTAARSPKPAPRPPHSGLTTSARPRGSRLTVCVTTCDAESGGGRSVAGRRFSARQ